MKLYAIVDIETTGGNASSGSITEIAVAIHNGKEVIEFYETLVRPNQYIPYFIQQLTGITNEMVASAPAFDEVADTIYHLHTMWALIILLSMRIYNCTDIN